MLAQGAYDIIGQRVAFVDPAADLADEAGLALGLGLGLDRVLIVGVGHGLVVRENTSLGDGADEHAVGIQIDILLHLQRHEGVDILRQDGKTVLSAKGCTVRKLVNVSSALKAEGFKAVAQVIADAQKRITEAGGVVDYVEIRDAENLEEPTAESRELLFAVAAFFGTTRLIDNCFVKVL